MDGVPFNVSAYGSIFQNGNAGKASIVLSVKDPSATVTDIVTPGTNGIAITAGTWANWTLEANLMLDSHTGLLDGDSKIIINRGLAHGGAINVMLTGLDPSLAVPLQFEIYAIFNVSD